MQNETYTPKIYTVTHPGRWEYAEEGEGVSFRLKVYTMLPQGQRFSPPEMADASEAVCVGIIREEIDPRIGVGFSIISAKRMDVCVWGGIDPSVLNQHVYRFERPDIKGTIFPVGVHEAGSFCSKSLEIVCHEAAAWREFLLSVQSEADLQEYFSKGFEGFIAG